MKCENCGGNLTLEDVVCPHCEAVNQHAIQHIRDMKRYQKDYEGTKEEVYEVTKRYVGVATRIIIITVLIVLIALCGWMSGECYSIKHKYMEAKSERKAEEYKEVIEEYLEAGEFYALAFFNEVNFVDFGAPVYQDYKPVASAVSNYRFFYTDLMRYIHTDDQNSLETYPSRIESDLSQFYKLFDEENYVNIYDSPHKDYIIQMKEQMEALMVAYFGMTKEEAEGIWEMSKAERMTLLEERLLHEEEN